MRQCSEAAKALTHTIGIIPLRLLTTSGADINRMNKALAILAISVFIFGTPVQAEQTSLTPAVREIMHITDDGFAPSVLTIKQLDGSVFFLNSSAESGVELAIEWGKRRFHCANPNLKLDADGFLRTVTPIKPRDFAISCFPDKGSYKVTAKGLRRFPKGVQATVNIE